MNDFLASRLTLALCYLAALFCGGFLLAGQVRHAEGRLFVEEGMTESVLVQESEGRGGLGALRGVPTGAIPFDNPRAAHRRLDRGTVYDMVQLPFHVRLDAVELLREHPPRDVLTVEGAELAPGETGDWVRFERVRPWAGVIPEPGGRPGAKVSVRTAPDQPWETVVLDETAWAKCEGVVVRMSWHDGADAARAALLDSYDPAVLAAWGVRDGGVEQWFGNLSPGMGATLSDGRQVRLLRFDAAPDPAITVRVEGGSAPGERRIAAGETGGDILFRCPPPDAPVVFLNAFGYNEGWVRVFSGAASAGERLLAAGETWDVAGRSLRLDAALAAAVLIRAEDVAVFEAVVRCGEETVTVREGESATLPDGRHAAYRRVETPPDVRYALTFVSEAGGKLGRLELATGEAARFGNWRFEALPNSRNALHSAVLHVARTLNRPAAWVGFLCFATGAVGLTVGRLRRPRRKRRSRMDTD